MWKQEIKLHVTHVNSLFFFSQASNMSGKKKLSGQSIEEFSKKSCHPFLRNILRTLPKKPDSKGGEKKKRAKKEEKFIKGAAEWQKKF